MGGGRKEYRSNYENVKKRDLTQNKPKQSENPATERIEFVRPVSTRCGPMMPLELKSYRIKFRIRNIVLTGAAKVVQTTDFV